MTGVRNDGGEEQSRLAEIGPALLVRLVAMIRTARLHDVSNQAFQRQVADLLAMLGRGMEEENEVVLVAAADYLYLNGVRLRVVPSLFSVYHSLIGEFESRGLGGLRFLDGVTSAELERFFQLFLGADDPGVAERLPEAVEEASITHIQTVATVPIDADDVARKVGETREPPTQRSQAKRTYWRAVLGTRKILARAHQTGRPDLRHAKRLVQPVVDSIMNHEYSVVGLTALKDHDEYTYAHCVNVSILSVSMGNALGFSRQTLADLGVAGLIHDIGKIAIPGEILRKPAKLDEEEWKLMRRHPVDGVKMMLRMSGLSSLALDSMRACLEHHMNYNHTGYPTLEPSWGQATMSRIVALADCFDAMTAHRSYHKRPFSPFEALEYLMNTNRALFDPAVMWALVRTVGLYPPGSMLATSSGHIVISVSPNPDDLKRPFCRVLVNPDGSEESEEGAETWDPMPPEVTVARVLRPEDYAVRTGDYLAA